MLEVERIEHGAGFSDQLKQRPRASRDLQPQVTPAEDPQVYGQGPRRVSLSDDSGTEAEKSDSLVLTSDSGVV